ncbi:MAG: glycosyltransferase family 1 protein [Bermanella sp.]
MLLINGKYQNQVVTGVQRVAHELSGGLPYGHIQVAGDGLKGHFYEQFILPFKLSRNDLLISFCNTGPIFHRNQVVYIHDVAVLEHPEWFSKSFRLLYRVMLPLLARRCKTIVTVSEYSKEKICQLLSVPASKVHVIENGVSDRFAAEEGGDYELSYGLEKKKYILSVSSMDPRKNMVSVIQAWEASGLHQAGYKLVFAGGGNASFSNANDNKAQDCSSIIYTGYVEDDVLVNLYQQAAGFVYMSLYEGFGLPVLEAMKAGVPVLASNTTSLAEVVGDYGLSCDPLDIKEITNLMNELPYQEDGFVSKAKLYADSFSWNKAVDKLQALLKEVE